MGYLKTILVCLLVFAAATVANAPDARATYGAEIAAASCDPGADVALDYTKTDNDGDYFPYKSCIGQKIRYDQFKVKVHFEPNVDFITLYEAINFVIVFEKFPFVYTKVYAETYSTCMASSSAAMAPLCQIAGKVAGDAALVGAAALSLVAFYAASDPNGAKDTYIAVGETKNLLVGGIVAGLPVAAASVYILGDKACVMLSARPIPFLSFTAERSADFNKKYGMYPGDGDAANYDAKMREMEKLHNIPEGTLSMPANCVYMPEPPKAVLPKVPSFISQTCIDYDSSASQFVWPKDIELNMAHNRSFVGVVVQCVEESFRNVFFGRFGTTADNAQSVFMTMQKKLQAYVLAMLALYIVMLGYKYGIMERGGLKKPDFIFAIIKVSCVMFFASSSGMTQLLPTILSTVKSLSAVVIDSATGSTANKSEAQAKKDSALAAYKTASDAYNAARYEWWLNMNSADAKKYKDIMDAKKIVMDDTNNTLQKAKIAMLSFGYDYCNFTPLVEAGKYKIPKALIGDTIFPYDVVGDNGTIYPEGTLITKGTVIKFDYSYMSLWDSIDCRISKYLGLGSNIKHPSSPQFLVVALGMLGEFWNPIGWISFALSITFLIFVLLIIIRIVQVYVISFVAIILLVYVSPIIFPLMLFEYTKSSFDRWFKQLLAYMLQPIILFCFLAFMFAVFDNIIWGGNDSFYPDKSVVSSTTPETKISDNTIHKVSVLTGKAEDCKTPPEPSDTDYTEAKMQNFLDNCRCPDENSIGCMLERYDITKSSVKIHDKKIINVYGVNKTANNLPGEQTASGQNVQDCGSSVENAQACKTGGYSAELTEADRVAYMVALLKIVFVCFIIHALLSQIEKISSTLTNAAMPASRMASVPSVNPSAIAGQGMNPVLKGAGKAASLAGSLGNAAFKSATGMDVKKSIGNFAQRNRIRGGGGGYVGPRQESSNPSKPAATKSTENTRDTRGDATAADPNSNVR